MTRHSSTHEMDAVHTGEGEQDSVDLTDPSPERAGAPPHIIRTIQRAHCKRGPDACGKC
jgi:hypothetical protein